MKHAIRVISSVLVLQLRCFVLFKHRSVASVALHIWVASLAAVCRRWPSQHCLTLMVPNEIEEEIQMGNWMDNIFFCSLYIFVCLHIWPLVMQASIRTWRLESQTCTATSFGKTATLAEPLYNGLDFESVPLSSSWSVPQNLDTPN